MGLFTYLVGGKGCCIKCNEESGISIQTHLLLTDLKNSSKEYSPGELLKIDGLDDFYPLHARDASSTLKILFADWECDSCGFNYQAAIATFDIVDETDASEGAKFISLEQVILNSIESLNDINYVENECLMVSYDFNEKLGATPKEHLKKFSEMSLPEKIERLLKSQKLWAEHHKLKHASEIEV